MFSIDGSSGHRGSTDSTSVAPRCAPRMFLISVPAAATIGSSALTPGKVNIDSRITPMRSPLRAPGVPGARSARCVGRGQEARTAHRREHVARVVVAANRILERVPHLGGVGDRPALDAGAVVVHVVADRAAEIRQESLGRQDHRLRVVVGRPATRRVGFLADAAHREVRRDRHRRAGTRSNRRGPRGVVRVGGRCRPRCCAGSPWPRA